MIITNIISPNLKIPKLENGDRLNRVEFERRYQAMPDHQKAELIEGIVYMASPLRFKSHGKPHAYVMTWLGTYEASTLGVEVADNSTVIIDDDNEPQPDGILRIKTGGQSIITEDDYIQGAPELIVEIAASTVSYDLHQKLNVYRQNQVQEYLVWRVYDHEFDWFKLNNGEYVRLEPDQNGIICSQIFPGLWLDINALLTGNLGRVLAVLQEGLATREHQEFVNKMRVID
jgi:Uma2 family endonuclease